MDYGSLGDGLWILDNDIYRSRFLDCLNHCYQINNLYIGRLFVGHVGFIAY